MDVRGIGDRHVEDVVAQRVRQRRRALEHVQRQELRRRRVDAGEAELDERQVVARREQARDAGAGGESLVDERLRERAARLGRAAADLREAVRREQPGRRDEVGDELGARVDAEARQLRRLGDGRAGANPSGGLT